MIAFSSNGSGLKRIEVDPIWSCTSRSVIRSLQLVHRHSNFRNLLTPELTVVEGGNSRVMDAKAIAALPGELLNYVPPVPRGYRKPLASPDRDTQTEGALLRDFLTSNNFNEVVLTPYVGKSVTLKKRGFEQANHGSSIF